MSSLERYRLSDPCENFERVVIEGSVEKTGDGGGEERIARVFLGRYLKLRDVVEGSECYSALVRRLSRLEESGAVACDIGAARGGVHGVQTAKIQAPEQLHRLFSPRNEPIKSRDTP